MKKWIFLPLFVWSLFSFKTLHIDQLSEFYITNNEDKLKLSITIEARELKSLSNKNECNYASMTAFCFTNYINCNLDIMIKGEKLSFELEEARSSKGHYIIYLSSHQKVADIENISIINNCFIEEKREFKNRMIIGVEGITKSYLLNYNNRNINLSI